ncbi:MAG: transcription antitermination protein NusB [Cyanobacteria bacterium Co-bin13]|nr:transcription antitermination protein NusB [Cyanobacteria bacterium Co-bin13]
MQARRIGRELALLGMSQFPDKPEKLERQDLESLISSAVRTLTVEAKDALETAADELKRGSNRIMDSETRASDVTSARTMVEDAIALTQNAINRLGSALELPEFVQITNQQEVRAFALEILSHTVRYMKDVDEILEEAMVAWQLKRLARIDRDILRTAVIEMQYLGTPDRVAINEAVELAKRYSGEDGFRFINGVLRRVVERGKSSTKDTQPSSVSPQADSTF